ncbi:hypothetical protein N8216_00140 [Flavobacteriaceae bacterium]|nr:hypothetical protein [Flavobacteriaceae bacterium]
MTLFTKGSKKRKILTYLGMSIVVYVVGFIVWSCIFPVDMAVVYRGDSAVGFYRFKIVEWDYNNGTTFYVIEELGGTIDYLKYLVGQYDPLQ